MKGMDMGGSQATRLGGVRPGPSVLQAPAAPVGSAVAPVTVAVTAITPRPARARRKNA